MRILRTFIASAGLAGGLASTAFGGAGTVNTVITQLQANVTYSSSGPQSLSTYVAYTVNVSNGGGNTINNIYFIAQTSVTDSAEKAVFSSAEGASCVTTNADQTAIQCTIGQLTAGQPAPTIALFFLAPVKVNGVAGDAVTLTGTTFYAETTGGTNSKPDNSVNPWDPVPPVTLGTDNPTLVKSGVPKAGGRFFTGAAGVPSSADVYASDVTFSPLTTFATLTINETPFPATDAQCLGGKHFVTCYSTLLNAPQVLYTTNGSYLTETIRIHPDNFVNGAKMSTVLWEYTPTDASGAPVPPAVFVGPCASATQPNTDGTPCQAKPVVCYNKKTPGWTAALDGVCEWTFINTKNGFQRGY